MKAPRSRAEIEETTAALRRVHGQALGYQPMRMKPVHFAAGFLLALTGRYRRLEWLNKAAVPKAAPKKSKAQDDYVAGNLLPILQDQGWVAAGVDLDSFRILRSHLNAAFNNDGAALAASFLPYDTFGATYSAPSLAYLSNQTKNHGYSGSFVARILNADENGRAFLDLVRQLLDASPPPLAGFGAPLVDEQDDEWTDEYDAWFGTLGSDRADEIAELMRRQTAALRRLAEQLVARGSTYAIRYVVIGLCAWLFLYMMRREANQPLLLIDAMEGRNARIRAQSRASYARELNNFSLSYDRWFERSTVAVDPEDWQHFATSDAQRQLLEDHFRDIGVRIGVVQPRAPNAKRKHVELQADTLRVLAFSLLEPGAVLPIDRFARELRETWHICTGASADDVDLLLQKGFGPLDADDDLEPNGAAFRALLVRLGLAVEPSDGLTLCAIDAEELI